MSDPILTPDLIDHLRRPDVVLSQREKEIVLGEVDHLRSRLAEVEAALTEKQRQCDNWIQDCLEVKDAQRAAEARLAEAEAERDALSGELERQIERADDNARGAWKAQDQRDAAEARLAEAIELLREMADAYDEATGDYGKEYAAEELSAARAFIEAHGEGA